MWIHLIFILFWFYVLYEIIIKSPIWTPFKLRPSVFEGFQISVEWGSTWILIFSKNKKIFSTFSVIFLKAETICAFEGKKCTIWSLELIRKLVFQILGFQSWHNYLHETVLVSFQIRRKRMGHPGTQYCPMLKYSIIRFP